MSVLQKLRILWIACLCAFLGVIANQAIAADEGSLDGPMHIFMQPFNNAHFSVISADGVTYSSFQPGQKVGYNGTVTILMKKGKIREYYIYMGNCSGDNCVLLPENQLVFKTTGDQSDPKFVQEGIFPKLRSHWIPGWDGSPTQSPVAGDIINKCNIEAQQNGDDSETYQFSHAVEMTLGVDTYRGITEPQEAVGGTQNDPYDWTQDPAPNPVPDEIDNDFTEHFQIDLPIVCEPLDGSPPDTDMLTAGELPDLELVAAELGLSIDSQIPASDAVYAGSCPMGLTLHAGVTTNVQGEVQGYIEHKNVAGVNWTSEEFTLSTESTEGSLWKKTLTDLQQLPFNVPMVPLDPGGGGVVNNQPSDGFQFNPGGGDSGIDPITDVQAENNTTDGNKHIGWFRFTAYTGKTTGAIAINGIPATTYSNYKRTGWHRYEVTCDPETSSVADTAPTGVQAGLFVEDSLLTLVPNNPEDGSACGIWTYGWIKTNTGNVPVTFRLRNQTGDLSGSQTIVTQSEDQTGNFSEYTDLTGSGSGIWVTPSGQWSLPDTSAVGNHVGMHSGSYQIAVSDPNDQNSNIADYDFECYPPSAVLNPNVATNNGGLVSPDGTSGVGLLIPAVQAAPDQPDKPVRQSDDSESLPVIVTPTPSPLPKTVIEAADPVVIIPEPEISVCKNGRISGNKCLCPGGWKREKISRFEFVCHKPKPKISCDGGKVSGGKCRCPQGWQRQKIGNNAFRCLKPKPRIICKGGKTVGKLCVCPQGRTLKKLGNRRFQCVKAAIRTNKKIICRGGIIYGGKCRCPAGKKLVRGACVR